MKLKTIAKNGRIVLKDYTEQEGRSILTERNSYVYRCVHCVGDDYGGSQCSDERFVRFEEIPAEQILVKDGHFCGVIMLSDYKYYNGGSANKLDDEIIYAGKPGSVRCGEFFGNDDHSRWDYTDYYLWLRSEAEKEPEYK